MAASRRTAPCRPTNRLDPSENVSLRISPLAPESARARKSRARVRAGDEPFAQRAVGGARAEGLAHGGRARPHVGQGRRDARDPAAGARRALGDHCRLRPRRLPRRHRPLVRRQGVARACAISASSAATAASSTGSTFASSTAASNFAPAATTAPPLQQGAGLGGCLAYDSVVGGVRLSQNQ
jgi:hypothetical protein